MSKKQRVIIIGRNYTSRLGMIRAIGDGGYDIQVIKTCRTIPYNPTTGMDIDGYSKYVNGYHFALEPNRQHLVSVIKSLALRNGEKAFIIPVDDYAASTIDEYLEDLKEFFSLPHSNFTAGNITKLMDKDVQKKLAQAIGLNVAHGWRIDVKDGQYTIPNDIKYPCFPKPEISFMGNKSCMQKCTNKTELQSAINSVITKNPNCPFLIEEYIEIEKEYAALGFSDGKRVFIPAMIQLLQDGSGPHKGVTLQGEILPPTDFQRFFDKVSNILTKNNFVGLFDIDSFESKGELYFNELNLRFGASGYAITASGINLPMMLLNFLSSGQIAEHKLISKNQRFVNEKVAIEDYYGGYISTKDYKEYLFKSDIRFIQSDKDPEPYRKFTESNSLIKTIKGRIKYLIKFLK